MKDKKLYTQFGSIRSGFLATLIFNFLTLRGSPAWTGWGVFVRYVSKIQKFNNLSKTGSPKKNWFSEKSREKSSFLGHFSTKTRHSSLNSLDRGTKVGFKMKYNCYILRNQVLKKIIWSWWGDIRVRTWNFENSQKTQLTKGMLKTFHVAIKLS